MREYYLVIRFIKNERNYFPEFYNCALVDNSFIEIEDLKEYVLNGKGLTENVIDADDFIPIKEFNNKWDKYFKVKYAKQ